MKLKYAFIPTCVLTLFALSVRLPAGWARPADAAGSLKGTVKFEGTAPKPAHIDMSQDPLCAKTHSTPATGHGLMAAAAARHTCGMVQMTHPVRTPVVRVDPPSR